MKATEQQIKILGWDIEERTEADFAKYYRAEQGGFLTLWRPDIKQVLSDVQRIVDCRKEADKAHLPF